MMNRYEDPDLQVGLPTYSAYHTKMSMNFSNYAYSGSGSLACSDIRAIRNS